MFRSFVNLISLVVIAFFAILASRSLIFESGYFNMHDDLQMMRQLEMEKCFLDGQIPCRWVPDMGYGYGFPLFNFYPPLPYLIGEIFRILGFSFVDTVKLNFALALVASGVTMYFLAKKFFGTMGGILSAIFYIWAPYHAVDVYVRGAMNETWALVFFPLIFLSSYQLICDEESSLSENIVFLAISYFALFVSHNLMVLIFTPFFVLWVLMHLVRKSAWSRLRYLIVSGVWALGLAAFFTLPALFENKFTQVTSQLSGYYEYTAHFVSLRQLFLSRFWGYGPSVWVEAEDKMSFQIGHLHWVLALVILVLLLLRAIRKVKNDGFIKTFKKDTLLVVTGYLLFVGWFSAYMTHLKSIWIYKAIPPLSYLQFPWRFLTLVIFGFSFIAGFLPGVFSEWKIKRSFFAKFIATPPQLILCSVLVLILVLLNWNYFKPEGGKMGPLTDAEKFSGAAWELQQTAGIYDYLPIFAKEAPKSAPTIFVETINGQVTLKKVEKGTYWALFVADVSSQDAILRINNFYFPNWRVFVKENGNFKEIGIFIPDLEKWGRMWIELKKGENLVYLQFFNTPIRTFSNIISLISWSTLAFYFLVKKAKKF